MKKDKKLAAALAAVSAYITSQEQAAMPAVPGLPVPHPGMNIWAISGRQSMMQMRNLMQLKTFAGFKMR
jgi:hypothetical protein